MRALAKLAATVLAVALAAVAPAVASALGPVAAAVAGASQRAGTPVVHTRTVTVAASGQPGAYTVACEAGEGLLSGGYAADTPVRVVSSFPSDAGGTPPAAGARPRAWTVSVVSDSRTAVRLRIAAECVADAGGESTVAAVAQVGTGPGFSVTADCPSGTVLVGGGYSSAWTPFLGTAMVRGSYPADGDGWSIDVAVGPGDPDVRARAEVVVYAVCRAGVTARAASTPSTLTVAAASPVCTGGTAVFAPTCVTPRSGDAVARCPAGTLLSAGGYQIVGTPPDYAVLEAVPSGDALFSFRLRGSTPNADPLRVRVTPVCLGAAAFPSPVVTVGPERVAPPPPARTGLASTVRVLRGVAAIALLLFIALLVPMARRLARRRERERDRRAGRRNPAPGGVEVVLRAQRTTYRVEREVA